MSSSTRQSQGPQSPMQSIIRRLLASLLILLVLWAIYAGIYWLNGQLFKRNYLKLVANICHDTSCQMTVLEYKQGIFHSSAKIFIDPGLKSLANFLFARAHLPNPGTTGLIAEETITHGPLLYDPLQQKYTFAAALIKDTVSFVLSPTASRGIPLFDSSTLATFHNEYKSRVIVSSGEKASSSAFIKWQGITWDTDVFLKNNRMQHLTSKFSLQPITLRAQDNVLNIATLTFDQTLALDTVGLWDGNDTITLAGTDLTIDNEKYSLSNLRQTSQFSLAEKQGYYNYTSDVSIEDITLPFLTIHPLQGTFSLVNLNARGLVDMQAWDKDVAHSAASAEEKKVSGQKVFASLITPATQLTMNGLYNTNFGKATLQVKAYWPQNTPLPNNFAEIQQNVQMQANVIVPAALMEHLLTLYFNNAAPPENSPEVTAQPSLQTFSSQLDALQDGDKISTLAKTRILSIVQTYPTTDAFSDYLNQLVLTKDVSADTASLLKSQYELLEKAHQEKSAEDKTASPPPTQPLTVQEKVSNVIDTYKNMGYIIPQNTNYIATITFANGQLKVNDKAVALPPQ